MNEVSIASFAYLSEETPVFSNLPFPLITSVSILKAPIMLLLPLATVYTWPGLLRPSGIIFPPPCSGTEINSSAKVSLSMYENWTS